VPKSFKTPVLDISPVGGATSAVGPTCKFCSRSSAGTVVLVVQPNIF